LNHKYLLKKLQSEEGGIRSYLAEDLVIKRSVIYCELSKDASEKEGRRFLLHARLLGQLKHPGLLPLYDMGLNGDRCFFTMRKPPGKHLLQSIEEAHENKGLLMTKSRSVPYMLRELSDTMAYLHDMGLSLGKLNARSVYAGLFGEVVIQDLSKVQKFGDPKSAEFQVAVSEDLRKLGQLAMRLWLLSKELDPYTIMEWDQKATLLPLELRDILDRCALQRKGAYLSASELCVDLERLLLGQPPSSREGDLIFSVKSKFKQHRPIFLTSAFLLMIYLIFFLMQSHYEDGMDSKREEQVFSYVEKKLEVKRKEEELSRLEYNLNYEKKNSEILKRDHERYEEERSQLKKESDEQSKELDDLKLAHKELEDAKISLKEEAPMLKQKIKQTEEELKSLSELQEDLQRQVADLPDYSIARVTPFLGSGKEDRENLIESLPYKAKSSWLGDYLMEQVVVPDTAIRSFETPTLKPEEMVQSNYQNVYVWQKKNELHIVLIKGGAELDHIVANVGGFQALCMTSSATILCYDREELVELKLSAPSNDAELIEINRQTLSFVPDECLSFSRDKEWVLLHDKKVSRGRFGRPEVVRLPVDDFLEIKPFSRGGFLIRKRDHLQSFPRSHHFKLERAPVQWEALFEGVFWVRGAYGLGVYQFPRPNNTEFHQLFRGSRVGGQMDDSEVVAREHWRLEIPEKWDDVTSTLVSKDLRKVFFNLADGSVWKMEKGLEGQDLIHSGGAAIGYSYGSLLVQSENGFDLVSLKSSDNSSDEEWSTLSSREGSSQDWRAQQIDFGLKITDKRVVNVWDFNEDERYIVIAVAPEDLAGITYSQSLNKILALGESGRRYFW
jgi:serine/threonine protein kinase